MDLLVDDRQPGFDGWLQRKLTGLAPGIRTAVEDWLRTLHDGGPAAAPANRPPPGTTSTRPCPAC